MEWHGQRCTAKTKRTDDRCKNYAIRGGNVCRIHGGGAPQVRRKADERVARARVDQMVRSYLTDRVKKEMDYERDRRLHVAEVLGLDPGDPYAASYGAMLEAVFVEQWDGEEAS